VHVDDAKAPVGLVTRHRDGTLPSQSAGAG
jgi:hypothetical protein